MEYSKKISDCKLLLLDGCNTNSGICFRKSVAPQARKIRVAPSAIRFIITFSVSEEVLKVYLSESYPGYKFSFPGNRASAGYHWKRDDFENKKYWKNAEPLQML